MLKTCVFRLLVLKICRRQVNVVFTMFHDAVSGSFDQEEKRLRRRFTSHLADYGMPMVIWMFCLFFLFQNLGGPGLFEPDEGRNAEKAREILLLNDWVTPHENFLPVLDKPIFFFWLIAFSYKLFGLSEWAARLPSALAALGCLAVVYGFARRYWGLTVALWTILILVTCTEFFILSRVVIFDMTLNFLMALALCSFYIAARTEETRERRNRCLLMYGAMAAGSLIKGPVALVIPAMIVFFYLVISREWRIWRRMHVGWGALLFVLLVAPPYLWMETRNPGYLEYFFWDENFGRFLSSKEFDRANPWYYFLGILFVGALPWSFLLPSVVKDHWRRPLESKNLFLVLWVLVPLIFFSASKAKLPHYILPIFAPLSILIARSVMVRSADSSAGWKWLLFTPWLVQLVVVSHLILGTAWPAVLPRYIRAGVGELTWTLWVTSLLLSVIYAAYFYAAARGYWRGQRALCLAHGLGALFFLILMGQMMVATSAERSAKLVAEKAARWIDGNAQVVFFDTYLTGTLFYLRADRPVWIVTHANKKKTVFGNYYVVEKRDRPETPWGKALYTFDEFREIWRESRRPMIVIVKNKNIPRMKHRSDAVGTELGRVDEYVLLTNQQTRSQANNVSAGSMGALSFHPEWSVRAESR